MLCLERALDIVCYASDKTEISSAFRIKCLICLCLLASLILGLKATLGRGALGPIGRSPRGGVDGF